MFDKHIVPSELYENLTEMVKNTDGNYSVSVLMRSYKVMWRLVQLDLYKEFGYESEKENPFFIESCLYV